MPSYYYPFVGGSCQEEIEDGCIILVMSSNEFDFFVQTLLHTLAVLHLLKIHDILIPPLSSIQETPIA